MTIDWKVFLQIASSIIAVCVGAILNKYLSKREKLVAYYGHIASHAINSVVGGSEVTQINTHAVVIRNNGNKTATNVRVSHNVLPNIIIYPETNYEVKGLPSGGKELIIPRITPKKEFTISYLYFPPITYNDIISSIESDAGAAKIINVRLQQIFPLWFNALCISAMMLGLIAFIYIVYEIGLRLF